MTTNDANAALGLPPNTIEGHVSRRAIQHVRPRAAAPISGKPLDFYG
jgi:hypothetical protein